MQVYINEQYGNLSHVPANEDYSTIKHRLVSYNRPYQQSCHCEL